VAAAFGSALWWRSTPRPYPEIPPREEARLRQFKAFAVNDTAPLYDAVFRIHGWRLYDAKRILREVYQRTHDLSAAQTHVDSIHLWPHANVELLKGLVSQVLCANGDGCGRAQPCPNPTACAGCERARAAPLLESSCGTDASRGRAAAEHSGPTQEGTAPSRGRSAAARPHASPHGSPHSSPRSTILGPAAPARTVGSHLHQKLHPLRAPRAGPKDVNQSRCFDVRTASKCASKRLAKLCNFTWGCRATCGFCGPDYPSTDMIG